MIAGRESFFSLGLKGYISQLISSVDDVFGLSVTTNLEDAWQKAPERLVEKIRSHVLAGNHKIRGSIWELYVWHWLSNNGFQVHYEQDFLNKKKKLDFLAEAKSGYKFYVEAKSFGPNESELLEGDTFYRGDFALKLRESLLLNTDQISEYQDLPVILAFSNSYSPLFQTPFETIRSLFGQPKMNIFFDDRPPELIVTDEGFWFTSNSKQRSFDAVILHNGLVPGFSSMTQPSIWLNPLSKKQFDFKTILESIPIYKSDKSILTSSRADNFVWRDVKLSNL